MADIEVRIAETDEERADAFAVRHEVFVEEQGVDEDLEYDEHEDDAVHFVAYDGEEAVGAARLREPEPGVGKVERVSVRQSRRGGGIGRSLIRSVEDKSSEVNLSTLKLHSQTRVAGFYERLGYERYGEEFEEAGIPHVEMRKPVD